MAAHLLHFTASFTLPPYRLLFHHRGDGPRLLFSAPPFPARPRFSVCRASVRRPRGGRKVLSNAELRNELKEFLSSVGLSEDHVPSTKELSSHGRNDLANVVRRRGYKLIRELLTNSVQINIDGSDMKEGLADKLEEATTSGELKQLEGQDEKAENLAEQTNLSDEVPAVELFPVSHDVHPHATFGGDKYTDQRTPVIPYSEMDCHFDSNSLTGEPISLVGATAEEKRSDFNTEKVPGFSNIEHVPEKSSNDLDSESEASFSFMGQVKVLDYSGESISSSTDASHGENYPKNPEYDSVSSAGISSESPDASTLEEKVAKFMADGYLGPVADNPSKIYNEIGGAEPVGIGCSNFADSGNGLVIPSKNPAEVQPVRMHGSIDDPTAPHETKSGPVSSPAKLDYPLGDNHSSGDRLLGGSGKIVDTEIHNRENQAEINRLKYMLHQKELELSRLKEEIEREKHALSFLQTQAEHEINKVQKLILEKDAELQAAEESLSGLKEVQIQYCGDGDIVEVAGSFNGWDHRIKMDPQPLASNANGAGSRKSRLWSTMLWLYPGVYEIKFIVDGHWKVDPEKESTTRGSICNNILQVD